LSFKNNKLKKKSIDADNNLKRCVNPRCRKFILESANYCIYCGIKQTDRIDLTPPKVLVCNNCGYVFDSKSISTEIRFCSKCGSSDLSYK
jgi:RNA polymerase subunit RPABC4/transcription elongation factor Spt4